MNRRHSEPASETRTATWSFDAGRRRIHRAPEPHPERGAPSLNAGSSATPHPLIHEERTTQPGPPYPSTPAGVALMSGGRCLASKGEYAPAPAASDAVFPRRLVAAPWRAAEAEQVTSKPAASPPVAAPTGPVPGRNGQYPLLQHVSGRACPRTKVLAQVEAYIARVRPLIDPPVLAELLLPDPNKLFRWKVALACGHNTEAMTRGRDDFPDQKRFRDPSTHTLLNPGQIWCRDDSHIEEPPPYQEIIGWISSKVIQFEPDPIEPRHGLDPEIWNLIRSDQPHSSRFWRVRLACGHHDDHVVTPVNWTPERGPQRATARRTEQMRANWERHWSQNPDPSPAEQIERAHIRRMLDLHAPTPEPEEKCRTCTHAHQIKGYQRIGWLIPPPKAPTPAKIERQILEERLARAESEADRLRHAIERLS